jgi:hypothetical protein
MTDNDPSIRVNIRTGTSTRRPEEKYPEEKFFEDERKIYFSFEIQYDNDQDDHILNTSLYDDELTRNPNIRLDIKSRSYKTTDLNGECTVCQSKFKESDRLCTLKCKHTFHYNCLKRWGQYKQDCPLCRVPIPILER